jgi:integrase
LTAAARQAGLTERGAHGLRKRRAEIMMERGASADQRMAILGHDSRATTHAYSKGADLIRVITGTHFANSPDQTANFAAQVVDK